MIYGWGHPLGRMSSEVDFLNNAYMQWEIDRDDWYKMLKLVVNDEPASHI